MYSYVVESAPARDEAQADRGAGPGAAEKQEAEARGLTPILRRC